MKTFALLAAAAMAVSTANAAECVLTEIATGFLDIVEDVYTCSDVTGYSIVPPSTNPTATQAAAICTKCSKLVAEAKKKTFPTCTFNIDGVETPLNVFFQKVVGACGSTTSGSAAGSSASANATITTTAPAATTATPKTSSGSSASSTTVKAPTPTPTTVAPKSAGVIATASAAVVAVATIAAYAL